MDIKGLLQKELSKIEYAQGLTSKDVKIDCDLGVAIITNIVKELNLLDVSRRSELLSAFSWVSSIGEQFFDSSKTVDDMVDAYQKSK